MRLQRRSNDAAEDQARGCRRRALTFAIVLVLSAAVCQRADAAED